MTVATILKDKGSRVVTVAPGDSIGTVCNLLAREKIGAVLVCNSEGNIVGVLSERDIVRGAASQGGALFTLSAEALMTRGVEVCTIDEAIGRVMQRMTEGRFRHMPVMRNGRLIGLVSIGDVVKQHIATVEKEAEELRRYIGSA